MKLEELIQKLSNPDIWTFERIEGLFGTKLVLVEENEYFKFYEIREPLAYEEGLTIEKVVVSFNISEDRVRGFTLNLSDNSACFSRERINKTYTNFKKQLFDIPRGRSLDEETSYKLTYPWGDLMFGFKERRPDCLSSVGFSLPDE